MPRTLLVPDDDSCLELVVVPFGRRVRLRVLAKAPQSSLVFVIHAKRISSAQVSNPAGRGGIRVRPRRRSDHDDDIAFVFGEYGTREEAFGHLVSRQPRDGGDAIHRLTFRTIWDAVTFDHRWCIDDHRGFTQVSTPPRGFKRWIIGFRFESSAIFDDFTNSFTNHRK